MPKSKMH